MVKEIEERLISETELMKTLGLAKPDLDRARRSKGLPYVKFSSKSRAYFLSDVIEWARRNRIGSDDEK